MNLLGRKALREEKGRGKKKNPAILTGMSLLEGIMAKMTFLLMSCSHFSMGGKGCEAFTPLPSVHLLEDFPASPQRCLQDDPKERRRLNRPTSQHFMP